MNEGASTATAAAYGSVRDRLVQLTVEIDDQERAAALLESAIEKETAAGREEQRELEQENRSRCEATKARQRDELEGLLTSVDAQLARKKELSVALKRVMGDLDEARQATATAVASAHATGAAELEGARATWEQGAGARRERYCALHLPTRAFDDITYSGSGGARNAKRDSREEGTLLLVVSLAHTVSLMLFYHSRLSPTACLAVTVDVAATTAVGRCENHDRALARYLAAMTPRRCHEMRWLSEQTREIREMTVKGLEPEIARLLEKHKIDCAEEERSKREAERAMIREMSEKHEKARIEQQGRLRGRWAGLEQTEREEFERESRTLQEEHARRLRAAQHGLADERESFRHTLADELQRLRERHDATLADARAQEATRTAEVRRTHAQERQAAIEQQRVDEKQRQTQVEGDKEAWLAESRRAARERARARVAERSSELCRERDMTIEREIRSLQAERLAREREVQLPVTERKRSAQQDHLHSLQALKAKRAEWVEKHVAAMATQQKTRESIARLNERIAEAHESHAKLRGKLDEASTADEAAHAAGVEQEKAMRREGAEGRSALAARCDELAAQLEAREAADAEQRARHDDGARRGAQRTRGDPRPAA